MQLASSDALTKGYRSSNGVYERVKAGILAQEFPPGQRIMVEKLADRLLVSHTPIREALVRLAAERLVNEVPKAGFFAKVLSETEIYGLYRLQSLLLEWSLSADDEAATRRQLKPPKFIDGAKAGDSLSPRAAIDVMDNLFLRIAGLSGNANLIPIVRNFSDRLHYARLKDYEEFEDPERRLPRLCEAYCQNNLDALQRGLDGFFAERIARLPELVRLVRMGDA